MAHIIASFVLANQNNELLTDIADIDKSESDNSDFENVFDQIPKKMYTKEFNYDYFEVTVPGYSEVEFIRRFSRIIRHRLSSNLAFTFRLHTQYKTRLHFLEQKSFRVPVQVFCNPASCMLQS